MAVPYHDATGQLRDAAATLRSRYRWSQLIVMVVAVYLQLLGLTGVIAAALSRPFDGALLEPVSDPPALAMVVGAGIAITGTVLGAWAVAEFRTAGIPAAIPPSATLGIHFLFWAFFRQHLLPFGYAGRAEARRARTRREAKAIEPSVAQLAVDTGLAAAALGEPVESTKTQWSRLTKSSICVFTGASGAYLLARIAPLSNRQRARAEAAAASRPDVAVDASFELRPGYRQWIGERWTVIVGRHPGTPTLDQDAALAALASDASARLHAAAVS